MKKLIMTILVMGSLFSQNLLGMEQSKYDRLVDDINVTLELSPASIEPDKWPSYLEKINKLIGDVQTAGREGHFGVSSETINGLKRVKDKFQKAVNNFQRKSQKPREIKLPKSEVGLLQCPQLVTLQKLISDYKINPTKSNSDNIKRKEDAIKRNVAFELAPSEPINLKNKIETLLALLDEINFAQQNGYLLDIPSSDIRKLMEMFDTVLSKEEELRDFLKGREK